MTELGARRLAASIVIQAVKDYERAKRKPRNEVEAFAYYRTQKECILFFRSEWFSVLTSLDPETVIHKLQNEKIVMRKDI